LAGQFPYIKFKTPIYKNEPDYYSQRCSIYTAEIPLKPYQSVVVYSNKTYCDVRDIGEVQ